MKVMIGEDNLSMRQTIRKFLENNIKGISKICECKNGEEAVNLFNAEQPNWTLLDVKMEPVDGLTAAKRIKEVNPKARIIFVSNYDDEEYRLEARRIHAFAYILKENLNELTPILKRCT